MRDRDFARSIISMRLLKDLGVAHGLSARICLAGTGVHEQDLEDPAGIVSGAQELRLIRNLLAHLKSKPWLGVEAGLRYHFTAFGMLGFAMASSATLRNALNVTLKYFDLTFAFMPLYVTDLNGETQITFDDSQVPDDVRQFIVERDVSILETIRRDLNPNRPALKSLQFSFPAPKCLEPYETAYGVRPRFGTPQTQVRLSSEALLQPLPEGNELALKAAEEQCKALLNGRGTQQRLEAKVRDRLAHSSPEMPDMATVAKDLCLTSRTLRRRLLDEGTTFIKLREAVRLQLAEQCLSTPNLSVEEISTRLGYSTPTSFINGFKRWKGTTPLSYRKDIRAAQQSCL